MKQPTNTLTPKQHDILKLLITFRFLDRTHIQTLLHHKDKRRINQWLKDLTKNQYVYRQYDSGIIGKNRVPAIYSPAPLGTVYIQTKQSYEPSVIRNLYENKYRSDTFIFHCLLIATICIQLEQSMTENKTYDYKTLSVLSDPDNPFHFLKNSLPFLDLVYTKKEKSKKTIYYLLTIFDETLPKYRVRKRLRDYYAFYLNNEWEDTLNTPFPILFFVCESKALMISAKRYLKQLINNEVSKDLKVYFAISEDVKENGMTGPIWEGI